MDEDRLLGEDTEVSRIPLQITWLHVCVAVSCNKGQIWVVVNGVKVLDTQFQKTTCPTSLVGNLVLFKAFLSPGFWGQTRGRVANVNVFSGLMSQDRMVSTTSGDECGKQNGDLLSWANSSWSLQGAATKQMEVSVENLCFKFSSIQLFKTSVVTEPGYCKNLCQRMQRNGRMVSVETTNQFITLKNRLRAIPNSASVIIWLPITRKNGTWVDTYTETKISMTEWTTGFPMEQGCAVYGVSGEGYITYECSYSGGLGGFYCSCDFPQNPFLTLRGKCKGSFLDSTYLPQNSPLDGDTAFYGNQKTIAKYLRAENKWKMESKFYNTTALSKEISGRFMLGKQTWNIEGDSIKCNEGKPYIAELKMTRCGDGEFTCDDGACVLMEERCNQVPDCRDKSDENGCQLIVFENNYNNKIPPIGRTDEGGTIPAQVGISITLMKVVDIAEVDHAIELQFQISMQWRENRAKYQNLKQDTTLNALSTSDLNSIWLPLIVYDNTDQKEQTRLGMDWEWRTTVAVTREEENPERSGVEVVDETEVFQGAENTLTMNQTYTWEFQCQYVLQRYPFDTQVFDNNVLSFHFIIWPQECKIEMTVDAFSDATVKLFASQVNT